MLNEVIDDPYAWLESVESDESLAWVGERNKHTLAVLKNDARYEDIRGSIEKVLTADDRIPYGSYDGQYVYNTWQDAEHVRGIIRRTSLESYRSDTPDWETVLDIDELAAVEDENWVYQDMQILPVTRDRGLVRLSRGGKDAGVVREFDLVAKSFVADGFVVQEAKTALSWLNRDTLLIGTDFGAGSLTDAGYPRVLKRWMRGTSLDDAEQIFTGERTDMGVFPVVSLRDDRRDVFVLQKPGFFESVLRQLTPDGELVKLPLPRGIEINAVFKGQLLVTLKESWTNDGVEFRTGSVVSIDMDHFDATGRLAVRPVIVPERGVTIGSLSTSRDRVYAILMEDVVDRLAAYTLSDSGWQGRDLSMPRGGSIDIVSASSRHNTVFATYSSFLTPIGLYQIQRDAVADAPFRSLPERFDASALTAEQSFVTSRDGTRVPYFLVRPKDTPFDGSSPTLQYGYGGFEISQKSTYLGAGMMRWVENGGCLAIANIRGGGEYGPQWHQAALTLNRQRAFDDFAAVSEDLIARKVTSPKKLGIQGGSNGGLLMGTMLTQRPDLYNAVICQVPLLDMLRFHKLLAGASWMAEFGNPDVEAEREFLASYSPYHNVKAELDYPCVLFTTSTKDDRVHPGHARKMVARMLEQGHDVLYYENIEGGHGGAANQKQQAMMAALAITFLLRQLAD